ncbi:MAG TPA: glycosyltransferase 87 family protein [Caulobacteraceae bacterium]|nr:glycosyltransferase 87 family protein [Caulobacteraceae bacterium]
MTGLQHQRRVVGRNALELAVGAVFAVYVFYLLMLGKEFSPSVAPPWYRDLGILWDNADFVVGHRQYRSGYFFPPSAYIIAHLFELLGPDLGFRLYLVLQVIAVGAALWAWARIIGLYRSANRSVVTLTTVIVCSFYIQTQLSMHNANAETFALVSLALAWRPRTQLSAGLYALSLAIKPYSSAFLLPWMVWCGYRGWVVSAVLWLLGFYLLLPVVWFGFHDTVALNLQWFGNLVAVSDSNDPGQLSVRAGLAALLGLPLANPAVHLGGLVLEAAWGVALAGFFWPTLTRRGAPTAMVGACEAAAILLIGLPLGSHQQPSRSLVLIAAALIITFAVSDARQPKRLRAILGLILAAIGLPVWLIPFSPLYFFMTLPICLLSLAGLAIVRASPTSQAPTPTVPMEPTGRSSA